MILNINTSKKRKILFVIILCFVILLTFDKPYASSLWDNNSNSVSVQSNTTQGIGEAIGGAWDMFIQILATPFELLNDFKNYVAEEALNGMISWVYEQYLTIASTIFQVVFVNFSPELDYFIEQTAASDLYFDYFKIIGYTLAIGLYIFMMISIAFNAMRFAEVKESPIQLTINLILSIFMIAFSGNIADILYSIANSLYDSLLALDESSSVAEAVINGICPMDLVDNLAIAVGPAYLIISFILGIMFVVSFFKFCFEIVEKYIISCLFYYLFPIPAATFVSKNTSSIFKKYIQFLIVQLLMLILNLFFIKIIINMLGKQLIINNIMGWIFLLSFMKVAQKIDNYALTMGLSVAISGGRLLDAAGSTMRNILAMGRGFSGAMNGAGKVMQMQGAASGNSSLIGLGMKMQNLSNPLKGNVNGTSMGNILDKADRLGGSGNVLRNMKPSDIDSSIIDRAKSRRYADSINQMPENTKEALFNQIYGNNTLPRNSQLSGLSWDFGKVKGSVVQQSENGEQKASFTLSSSEGRNSLRMLKDNEGNSVYLSSDSKLMDGQICSYDFDASNPEAVTMAELSSGRDFSALGDLREDIASVEGTADGGISFRDIHDDMIAKMDSYGNIAYNTGCELDADSLGRMSSFKDLNDLRITDNENGTVSVRGEYVVSEGSLQNTMGVKEYTLYNKAVYDKDTMSSFDGKYVCTFGNNNQNTGAWYVKETKFGSGRMGKDREQKAMGDYQIQKESANTKRVHINPFKL